MKNIRPLALLIVLLLVPACGGGGGGGGGGSPGGGPGGLVTLFQEDFAGAFPGTNWLIVQGSDTAVNAGDGNPIPALYVRVTRTGMLFPYVWTTNIVRTAVAPFNSAGGLTVSLDLRSVGEHVFRIYDSGNGAAIATLIYSSGIPGLGIPPSLTYTISGANSSTSIPSDALHRLVFQVDAAGNASWKLDGITQFSQAGFPVANYVLEYLSSGFYESGGRGSVYGWCYTDNVTVTSP